MNILVVDDSAINRKVLRIKLAAKGHVVREAGDGVEALQVLSREPVDAIVSDLLMPNMDGYRFCEEVRKNERFCALPFIMYTATYTSLSDQQLAKMVGADHYIMKPSPVERILEAIADAAKTSSGHRVPRVPLPDETTVLKQYSVVLVHKLEEKIAELQETHAKLEQERERILELNRDLESRVALRTEELKSRNHELTQALANVKELTGLIPICAYCKKIRDDKNYWDSVESYISRHTTAQFTHGICPDCMPKFKVSFGES